jgi:hypothetical protein
MTRHGTLVVCRSRSVVAEVQRLTLMGASEVSIGQGEDASWVVMADPEGNEFCVLRALMRSSLRPSDVPRQNPPPTLKSQ